MQGQPGPQNHQNSTVPRYNVIIKEASRISEISDQGIRAFHACYESTPTLTGDRTLEFLGFATTSLSYPVVIIKVTGIYNHNVILIVSA